MKRISIRSSIAIVGLLGTLFFAFNPHVQAQTGKRSGVYLTADDYQNHRISFEGQCGSSDHNLELHDVLHKSYIHVKHDSKKKRYEKNNLFGFQSCDGRDFRFASNLEYQILEPKELYIYVHESWVSRGRSSQVVQNYYFSVGGNGPVEALTLGNLKAAFPNNLRFLGALFSRFDNDGALTECDKSQATFTVNRLLRESQGNSSISKLN